MCLRPNPITRLLLSLAVLGQAACSSTNSSSNRPTGNAENVGYSFFPEPAQADVYSRVPGRQKPLSVLGFVTDVRDATGGTPAAVEVRMRFENTGSENVRFDPRTLSLVNGMLQPFSPPAATPATVFQIAPNTTQDVIVVFPFPSGQTPANFSLDNLRLRWNVEINNQVVPQAVMFQKVNDSA